MRVILLKAIFPLLALSSFINPFYGVLNYTFISIVRPEQLTYGVHKISGVFAFAISCLFISCLLKEQLIEAMKRRYFLFFLWFTVALYASTLTSSFTDFTEPKGSMYYLNSLPQIFAYCLCLYAVLTRLTEKEFERYVLITLFLFCFMGIWGIEQYFRGNELVEQLFGTSIVDRCGITAIFVMYLPMPLYFLRKRQTLLRFFGFIAFGVFTVMIVLTQSRAGYVGMAATLFAMFLYSRRKIIYLFFAGILALTGFIFAPEVYLNRVTQIKMQDIYQEEITDYSTASRILLWKTAFRMIAERPLLGVGNLNYAKANIPFAESLKHTVPAELYEYTFGNGKEKKGLSHTHNTFINILVEGGVLAAFPLFVIMLVPLWRGHKLRRSMKGQESSYLELLTLLNCGMTGFFVTAAFANLLLMDYIYWNLTIAYFLILQLEKSIVPQEKEAALSIGQPQPSSLYLSSFRTRE